MHRERVDIGDGELEAIVDGDGPMTVVFESGLATSLEIWDAVAPAITPRARTVRYDHRRAAPAGALSGRAAADIVGDLERLLTALRVRPPYVLVGHSWGGVIARLMTHAHPRDVVGLVFVDATHEALGSGPLKLLPAMYALMGALGHAQFVRRAMARQLCPPGTPPAYRARIDQHMHDPVLWRIGLRTAKAEAAAIAGALEQLRTECPELPPIPVHVLTAGRVKTKSALRVHEAWRTTVSRAADARYTNVPASGHYMPIEAPDAIVDAIVGILDTVQESRR